MDVLAWAVIVSGTVTAALWWLSFRQKIRALRAERDQLRRVVEERVHDRQMQIAVEISEKACRGESTTT